MKEFIKKSVFFAIFSLLFFILINSLYIGIIVKTDFDFRKRIESLNLNNPDFDLLVLGASTTFDGFDAELLNELGIKSYNLALGGSTVKANIIQLKEYLQICTIRPGHVILGLNSQLVKTFDDEVINPIIEVTMEDHVFGINDVPLLKFKWLGFEFFKKIISKKQRRAALSYGQLKFQKTNPDHTTYKNLNLDINEYKNSHWIAELSKICSQNCIELIILEMPGFRETQNSSDIGPYSLSFSNGYSANLYNFGSMEFCNIFNPNVDWIGNSHLNELGAAKFTSALFEILHMDFFDHP